MDLIQFRQKYDYDHATKVMRQYLDVKFTHQDCLVLFRMGDFYELFYDDATFASQILGIALTKRTQNSSSSIAMCGVPHHALEPYLKKLVEDGHKIAICDQLETPEEAKKRDGYKAVVRRDVTRVITPGTIIEESLINVHLPNYLASLVLYKNSAAICYVDISVSEISLIEVPQNDILDHLLRIAPKEIILSENCRVHELFPVINKQFPGLFTYQVDSFFDSKKCNQIIIDFYNIANVDAIGELSKLQISSLGSILEYLCLTQKQHLSKLPLPQIINYHNFMHIDGATRRSLEITSNLLGQHKGSLFNAIDYTSTRSGSRLLYKFLSLPLTNLYEINYRLQLTKFFYSNMECTSQVQKILKNTSDLERCSTRILMNKSSPRDLISIKNTLSFALDIKREFMKCFGFELPAEIEQLIAPLSGDDELYNLIDNAILGDPPNSTNEGGFIKHEYHYKVKELYDLINNGKLYIERLKKQYQNETSIDTLKISHNNVLGLFIDITIRNSSKITDSKFIHRQTTTNNVRYTTIELQRLESDMVNAKNLVINLEQELYSDICMQINEKLDTLKKLANSLSMIDVFCSFAYLANEFNYVEPKLDDSLIFDINAGRHTIVEQSLNKDNSIFVNNDCHLSVSNRIWLITGPNMSGKSTFLRQNAIIAILAQIGSFVPAIGAKIGIIDKIFSRIGSGDDISKGQSTFMIEMLETSTILAQATDRSLVILDEVGRGTSTYDGMAIAWSVLEHIHDKLRCRCLFATHYHELTALSASLRGLENYTISIEESDAKVIFLYEIIAGSADKSYGVHVASIAGLPQSVINRANELLQQLENKQNNKNMLKMQLDNLSLFDVHKSEMQGSLNDKKHKLSKEFDKVDPDQLSPKQALETIYRLKNIN